MGAVPDRAQPDLRQIEDLTNEMTDILTSRQIRAAARAERRDVINDLVRHRDLLQMPARMAALAARLAARRAAQALRRRRLREPIRRRRPRRVARVLHQPPPQLSDLSPKLDHLDLEPLDRRRLLSHQRSQLLIRREARRHTNRFAAAPPVPAQPEQSLC